MKHAYSLRLKVRQTLLHRRPLGRATELLAIFADRLVFTA